MEIPKKKKRNEREKWKLKTMSVTACTKKRKKCYIHINF